MSLFEPGPWDKREGIESAHVFSKKRKLLYGAEHDDASADAADGVARPDYGERPKDRMHAIWRKNALKQLGEVVKRSDGKEPRVYKDHERSSWRVAPWPGDLGKHHSLIEELIDWKVVTMHQDDKADGYARIHPEELYKAISIYCKPPTLEATHAGTAPDPAAAAFTAASAFEGARAGYVFKRGAAGVGYYLDGVSEAEAAAAGATVASLTNAKLPDGWVSGKSPEGYTYYWHAATSTSSWEV